MAGTFNIYCDESCHLEKDRQRVMVLGAMSCPLRKAREVAGTIREIKAAHGYNPRVEMKWGKVSPGNLAFYEAIVAYFAKESGLRFRAVIVPDKSQLDHATFNQDHDGFYYKMYFTLLDKILDPESAFRIYLDIKDTRSAAKAARLREFLCNRLHDWEKQRIRVQHVRSHEVEQVQLVDVLTGAVSYASRGLDSDPKQSPAKRDLVKQIASAGSVRALNATTVPWARKINILRWVPRSAR